MCVCVCQQSGAHAFGSVNDTRDTHGGENVDTPIGQCVLFGNFRRRLARELLVSEDFFHINCLTYPQNRPKIANISPTYAQHSLQDGST